MNKWLLGWNIIITIMFLMAVISGCSSIDPQFTSLQNQVNSNRAAIEQLAAAVNEDRTTISQQASTLVQLQTYIQTAVSQLQATVNSLNK